MDSWKEKEINILVADDDVVLRKILDKHIKEWGCGNRAFTRYSHCSQK